MVADCPASYPDQTAVHRCMKTVPDEQYNYLLDLPVYSLNTRIMYRLVAANGLNVRPLFAQQ